MSDIAIVGAARTPIGLARGHLAPLTATDLGALALAAALDRAGLAPDRLTALVLGAETEAEAQALAPQLGLSVLSCAGPDAGLQAVWLACGHLATRGGFVVAGGMASLTRHPDAWPAALAEGGELAFVQRSQALALDAEISGRFNAEIVPVTVPAHPHPYIVTADQGPRQANPHPGAAAAAADGAAALVLMRLADVRSLRVRALIRGTILQVLPPNRWDLAPISAIQALLSGLDWGLGTIDLWQIDERLARLPLATRHGLGLPEDRLNIHGGAAAFGHCGAAAGACDLVTLLHALEDRELARGIVATASPDGSALAMAVERP